MAILPISLNFKRIVDKLGVVHGRFAIYAYSNIPPVLFYLEKIDIVRILWRAEGAFQRFDYNTIRRTNKVGIRKINTAKPFAAIVRQEQKRVSPQNKAPAMPAL